MANRRRNPVVYESFWNRYYAVWMTLFAISGVGAAFAAGVKMGYRSARVASMQAVLPDPLEQLDAEKEQYRTLTFHTELTHKKKPTSLKPSVPEGVERIKAMWMDSGAQKGECVLQLGAFKRMDEAQADSSLWERRGFKPFVREVKIQGVLWHRVSIGRFPSELWAWKAKEWLMKQDVASAVVCLE